MRTALREAARLRDEPEERRALRDRLLEQARRDGIHGSRSTGVTAWVAYHAARDELPYTVLTESSQIELKVQAETRLLDFAVWYAKEKPSGRAVNSETLLRYMRQILKWHRGTFKTDFMGGLSEATLVELINGISEATVSPPARPRWGVRTQDLAAGIEADLDESSRPGSTWAALFSVGFQGLMRGCELGVRGGRTFDTVKDLTRADLKFGRARGGKRFAQLTMRVGKRKGAIKDTIVIFTDDGTLVNAYRRLRAMVDIDPVSDEEAASVPLFRHADGAAISVSDIRRVLKWLMQQRGLDPARFGAHSLRIGGATAALAAGLSPAAIRAAGRWGSDVYQVYTRATREAAFGLTSVIGSTPFQDLERGVEFIDEDLFYTTEDVGR